MQMRKRLLLITLAVGMGSEVTTASAQDPSAIINLFGSVIGNVAVEGARTQWAQLPRSRIACIAQALLDRGASVGQLIQQGIGPDDPRIAHIVSICRKPQEPPRRMADPTSRDGPQPSFVTPSDRTPVPTGIRSLSTLEKLVQVPSSCVDARAMGREQLHQRDPFSGRTAPGPACEAIRQCYPAITAQARAIITFLRQSPNVLAELRRTAQGSRSFHELDQILRTLNSSAEQQLTPRMSECTQLSLALSSRLFWVGRQAGLQGTSFERFGEIVSGFAARLRNQMSNDEHASQNLEQLVPHYPQAAAYQRARSDYRRLFESDLEQFLSARAGLRMHLENLQALQMRLQHQTARLEEIGRELTELSRKSQGEPLRRLVNDATKKDIEILSTNVARLASTSIGERGDADDSLSRIAEQQQILERSFAVAQKQHDDLRALDSRREAVIAKATEALKRTDRPAFLSRINEKGAEVRKTIERLRAALVEAGGVSIFERADHTPTIEKLESALKYLQGLERNDAETLAFADQVRKFTDAVKQRGAHLLDPDASAAIKTLVSAADSSLQTSLPLTTEQQNQLRQHEKLLAELQTTLPSLMDSRERQELAKKFPFRRSPWAFNMEANKLTDAQSVKALADVESSHTHYQIEITCTKGSALITASTFNKRAGFFATQLEGKRIPWGGNAGLFVAFRIDAHPVGGLLFLQGPYQNVGIAELGKSIPGVLASSRIILGGLIPGEQLEIQTKFPETFQRACLLVANS